MNFIKDFFLEKKYNKNISFNNLVSAKQITKNDLDILFLLSDEFRKNPKKNYNFCKRKILASLFFEPSTRTRFSFEAAMLRLGGRLLSLEGNDSSSIAKGESLKDMGRMISYYADIAVIRNSMANSVNEFSKFTQIPVINAGDGANEHPTQALIDLYTILVEKRRLNNLKIILVGDLKYSRAFHSFLQLITKFDNNKIILVSCEELKLNTKLKEEIISNNISNNISESDDLRNSIIDADILYASRIQKERFDNISEYEKVRNYYFIDKELINFANNDLILMHALPKIDEIAEEVDQMPQVKYFDQASYAIFVRMALLYLMTRKIT